MTRHERNELHQLADADHLTKAQRDRMNELIDIWEEDQSIEERRANIYAFCRED